MLFFITILVFFNCVLAFEPPCSSCKHFVPNVKIFDDLGLCNMFNDVSIYKDKKYVLANYAVHCRENENLCGKSGFLYEAINVDADKNQINKNVNKNSEIKINDSFDELNDNKYFKELDETEKLEKEFFDILQKIKKHNTKRIYNRSKDLYKLFKKDKPN